jgi:nitrous oxide reductase
MSDFFDVDNSASAVGTIEREMIREESRHIKRRRFMAVLLAAAIACVVLLGGSLAARATARKPAAKAVTVAPAKHVKPSPSTSKHK